MFAQSSTEEDSSVGVTPPIHPRMPWRVREVKALPGFRLQVRFADGLEGFVDMSALLNSTGAGVFAELADPERFARVFVAHGAVTWPGELDLAPDAMYSAINESGEWVLQ